VAYDRTKTMNRMIAGEMARRSDGTIASVAASPPFVIDKDDPALQERWPKGFTGAFWRVMTAVAAKPPSAAGGPIADLVLAHPDRESLNGVLVKRDKPAAKRDKAMGDEAAGQRLWSGWSRLRGSEVAPSSGSRRDGPTVHRVVQRVDDPIDLGLVTAAPHHDVQTDEPDGE
jgi:hypothetical protein